jgi:hypothetical protein
MRFDISIWLHQRAYYELDLVFDYLPMDKIQSIHLYAFPAHFLIDAFQSGSIIRLYRIGNQRNLLLTRRKRILALTGYNRAPCRLVQTHPCRARFAFPNGINQASETRQLIRTLERNPEVQTIAARAKRVSTIACRKCAEWGQVCRFPQ